jgi:hypothetical protein
VKLARRRFLEGVAAVDLGKYETARLAFQQAYALKPHPSILRNLGQAEFQVGRYLEAARHLSTFLRDTTFGAGDERAAAQKTLALTEAKVGKLVVDVADGGEVSVDGELVEHPPIATDPFYVEPGQRTVRIRREGFLPYEGVHTFEGGRTTELRIELKPVPREPLGGGPLDPPYAAGGPALASDLPSPLVVPPDQAPVGRIAAPGGRERGFVVALATTGGLTAISVGVWVGFALEGASLQRQEDRLKPQISGTCSQADAVDTECVDLHDVSQRRATANQVATIGAVAAGVSAAAFVATWLFWPKAASENVAPRLLPHFGSNGGGVDFVGVFE